MKTSALTTEERTRRAVALTAAEAARPARAAPVEQLRLQAGPVPADSVVRLPGLPPGSDPDYAPEPPTPAPGGRTISEVEEAAHEDAARLPALIWAGTPVDRWVKSEHGLRRWRPIVDKVDIIALPDNGRLIEFGDRRPLRLDAELSAHIAWQLMPKEWQIALGAKGIVP